MIDALSFCLAKFLIGIIGMEILLYVLFTKEKEYDGIDKSSMRTIAITIFSVLFIIRLYLIINYNFYLF
jgi:hypothetical protein